MRLTATPPASAIGFSDRSPALNVLPGFQSPPPGYGIAPFYWWLGDPITKEHLEVRGIELRMDKDGKVTPETLEWSLNPMHPMSGKWYADGFFGEFEKKFPSEAGTGLNFFFSDELAFGVSGKIWSKDFAKEFQQLKGYDITPELPALFKDTGPRTPKIRLDYADVLTALSEEGFFKPVFDWHQQRGMIMGCDHGGRGKDVVEFGDYFRTQRWNQGPGSDQPQLGKDLIKAKVASSIAHLYQRPRVWLEGFYGSSWGTSSADLIDATFANYAMGYNLLGLHGMYYSTHGGWWEWAPPDNTFRMPYWKHLRGFMDCQQRLAYLLSQGDYRCDAAILYPVEPHQAVRCAANMVAQHSVISSASTVARAKLPPEIGLRQGFWKPTPVPRGIGNPSRSPRRIPPGKSSSISETSWPPPSYA